MEKPNRNDGKQEPYEHQSLPLTQNKRLPRIINYPPIKYSLDLPRLGISGRHVSFKSAAPGKQVCTHEWQFSEAHADRMAFKILQVEEFITELCTQQAEAT